MSLPTATSALLMAVLSASYTKPCEGFASYGRLRPTARQNVRRRLDARRPPVVTLTGARKLVFAMSAPPVDIAGTVEVGVQGGEEREAVKRNRPKLVKPWLTKAQETVDYSNVEAM